MCWSVNKFVLFFFSFFIGQQQVASFELSIHRQRSPAAYKRSTVTSSDIKRWRMEVARGGGGWLWWWSCFFFSEITSGWRDMSDLLNGYIKTNQKGSFRWYNRQVTVVIGRSRLGATVTVTARQRISSTVWFILFKFL